MTEDRDAAWTATEMQRGLVTIGHTGGCLFVRHANEVVGLGVKFTAGFTGSRSLSLRGRQLRGNPSW